MKTKILFLIPFSLILASCGGGSRNAEPSFAGACAADIERFCSGAGDVTGCMFNNFERLTPECNDAVFNFAGQEFGWQGNWQNTPRAERAAFIKGAAATPRQNAATMRAGPFGGVGFGTGGFGTFGGVGMRF
ncbi:MAG: hypothetical protein FWG18_02780 [Alphaproteobacteria bacterium]|nr:hypothetical protein [Alphaproteobacteria bacterium]